MWLLEIIFFRGFSQTLTHRIKHAVPFLINLNSRAPRWWSHGLPVTWSKLLRRDKQQSPLKYPHVSMATDRHSSPNFISRNKQSPHASVSLVEAEIQHRTNTGLQKQNISCYGRLVGGLSRNISTIEWPPLNLYPANNIT